MIKSDPLIRTKLQLPFQRLKLVPRPRLKERLAQGLQGPLTLVTAPAGFGKTTLVASCITGFRIPLAWLSLDKNDNQVERFLNYLVAALQNADDTIGSEAVQLMAAPQPARPEAVLTSLVNDLETAHAEIVLVLDDYQFINSQDVHEAVAFILEYSPNTLHMLMATRSDPPLPLARMRARGQLVELRAADLRFTEAETTQFLNEVMGLDLDEASVTALEKRTEGWIAGLQMAALSMRDRKDVLGFIAGFSGTNRYIMDYLLEEVLASQPPEIQHFLLYTSILDRLTAPLCDSLVARHKIFEFGDEGAPYSESLSNYQSAAVLEDLEQLNLFLVALDDEQIWYRYHHLFADLLRARLQQTLPGFAPRLHLRAADWLEQNGFIGEAILHLFLADQIDQAADLIEHYGPAHLMENDPSVLQMAEALPQEMILARPKLGLYQTWLLILQGSIGKALSLLNDLARQLAVINSKSGQSWMGTIVTVALAFLVPPTGTRESETLPDPGLLAEIPAEELILRNAADFLYAMALDRQGDLDRAVEFSVSCIQREKAVQESPAIPTLAPFLARGYLMQGRLHAAADLCSEFLDPLQGSGFQFIYTAGSMKIDLGEVLYEWNRLEEAEQHIRDGLRANEPWGNVMTDSFGLVALTRVLQAKGDYPGAMQVVEQLETEQLDQSRPREFEAEINTLRVRLQLANGDLQDPARWADQFHLSEGFDLQKEQYRLTLASIRLAQSRYAEVEKLLAGMAPAPSVGSRITRQLESNLLLAAAVAGQGRLLDAFALIETCLAMAEPEGYIRIFLNVGEPVRDLLAAFLRETGPNQEIFAQKILEAFSASFGPGAFDTHSVDLIEPLTARELEVLQVMALGKTNREIARKLVVAPGTVKAHAASIYRKLDVANRTEAVGRARQLGVIP